MIRKVVLGSGLMAFIPTVRAATPIEEPKNPTKPGLMRPSDLPLYDVEYVEPERESSKQTTQPSKIRQSIIQPVRLIREQVQSVLSQTEHVYSSVHGSYTELRDHSEWIVKYLREEENKEVRFGAVVMGGLTGFIFGLRGGIIRKVIYMGAGVTAMGALCFPEDTSDLVSKNGALARQYVNIAYNFLYGVKPGDPQLEVKFPELSFPQTWPEFKEMTVSLATSVTKAVMPPPAKEDTGKSEKKE